MSARLLAAAKVYAFNYLQDEAEEVESCTCGPKQHAEARELFAAIKEAESAPSHAASTEPVAWMRDNESECTTAKNKRWMETAGFGVWDQVAAKYTIPLFTATQAAQQTERDAVIASISALVGAIEYNDTITASGIRQVYKTELRIARDFIDAAILANQSQKGD